MVRPKLAHPRIDPDGCYLVTGGFGGFGLATARWLAAEGAGGCPRGFLGGWG
ncbi:KR domain-containing protein [Nocardia gipuzkoensis]|uniref:KR domain-containing protein n=1 Tax=Nocardia gipuzkoensis TaxID=2749991 RepID=UPI003CC80017